MAGVPAANSNYQFEWELVAYDYNLTAGNSTQECVVVNYLVQPIGIFPPGVPGGFTATSVGQTSAALQWDQVSSAAGYVLQRSSSTNGTYTTVETLTGASATSYTDSTLQPDTAYYYEVYAYAGSPPVDGLPASPLTVQTLGAPAPTGEAPLMLSVDFKVGSTDQAKMLVANEPLEAIATIKNNQNSSQTVLFITTLYGSNGAMVNESSSSITITANATGTTTDSFTLPGNVASCTVSAFVWDGGSLQSSKVTLLSNIVTIP